MLNKIETDILIFTIAVIKNVHIHLDFVIHHMLWSSLDAHKLAATNPSMLL